MPADNVPVLVHDRTVFGPKTLPFEKASIVAAPEEASLLALGSTSCGEPCARGFGPRLLLRLRTERESHASERVGTERCEHVGLVFSSIGCPCDEQHLVTLDDARVVTRPESVGSRARCERQQLVEAECAVAANAGIRRLARLVPIRKRLHDHAAKLLPKIQRHVGQTKRVASTPRGRNGCR